MARRKEIEDALKACGNRSIAVVYKEGDQLGMLCSMRGGYLMDCYNHRAPQEIWGYMWHEGGRIYHRAWDNLAEDVRAHSYPDIHC